MSHRKGRAVLAALACYVSVAFAEPASFSLGQDEWSRPRRGDTVGQMQPVAAAVRAWMVSPKAMLTLRYPANEEGALWGAELRGWLVALGVDASAVRLQADAALVDELKLTVDNN